MLNYKRVMPRDLFAEGNLLKCLGGVAIALERWQGEYPQYSELVELEHESDTEPFAIGQCQITGEHYGSNIYLRAADEIIRFGRPMYSRDTLPLVADINEMEMQAFVNTEEQNYVFSEEFSEKLFDICFEYVQNKDMNEKLESIISKDEAYKGLTYLIECENSHATVNFVDENDELKLTQHWQYCDNDWYLLD